MAEIKTINYFNIPPNSKSLYRKIEIGDDTYRFYWRPLGSCDWEVLLDYKDSLAPAEIIEWFVDRITRH